MLPIFKEYIEYLKNSNINEPWLKEGCFWIDNQIIKGFKINDNNELEQVKLLRLKVDENLKLTKKYYPKTDFNQKLLSWEELYLFNAESIHKLESDSLNLIKSKAYENDKKNIVLTSGGKDSILTSYLAKLYIASPRLIFNNTSLDVAETYKYIKSQKDIEIINPKEGFYQWRKRLNFVPTRFARACCNLFKEGELLNYLSIDDKFLFIMGMRNDESFGRSKYTDEWKNDKWKTDNWNAILPIIKWDELSVWLYIIHNDLDINKKYKMGYSRVGCGIACPYYSKTIWALDSYWYPKLFKRWQNILKNDFVKNSKALIMNCTLSEYMINWNGGIVRESPTKDVIEEFSKMNNLDYDIASKYFSHTCEDCGKKIKNKNVIAMNLKLHGRQTSKLYCKKHLMKMYNLSKGEWDSQIDKFKNQGCDLF